MDPINSSELDSYIEVQRKQGVGDDFILQKLVSSGWDKTLASRRLMGESVPLHPPTLSRQAPLQIENVQVASTASQTRIGILTLFLSVSVFIIGFFVFGIFTDIRRFIFSQLQWGDFDPYKFKEHLVVYLSILIPLGAVFIYCYRRVNTIISKENPPVVDDAFYRRNIRSGLRIAVTISILLAVVLLYTLLSSLILNETFDKSGFADTLIAFIVTGLISAFFWNYSKKSTR